MSLLFLSFLVALVLILLILPFSLAPGRGNARGISEIKTKDKVLKHQVRESRG